MREIDPRDCQHGQSDSQQEEIDRLRTELDKKITPSSGCVFLDINSCPVETLRAELAGQAAERKRCAEIARTRHTNEDGNSDAWTITTVMTGERIAKAIEGSE